MAKSAPLRGSLAIVGIAALVACGAPSWRAAAVNDTGGPFVVRITLEAKAFAWSLPPGASITLLTGGQAPEGTIELLDPATCEVLDQQTMPTTPYVVAFNPPDHESDTYHMVFAPAARSGPPPVASTFAGCGT